jgi:hypothetical protein
VSHLDWKSTAYLRRTSRSTQTTNMLRRSATPRPDDRSWHVRAGPEAADEGRCQRWTRCRARTPATGPPVEATGGNRGAAIGDVAAPHSAWAEWPEWAERNLPPRLDHHSQRARQGGRVSRTSGCGPRVTSLAQFVVVRRFRRSPDAIERSRPASTSSHCCSPEGLDESVESGSTARSRAQVLVHDDPRLELSR